MGQKPEMRNWQKKKKHKRRIDSAMEKQRKIKRSRTIARTRK